jgi:hypothetical protein
MSLDRVESSTLVEAGLAAMRQSGRPLSKLPSKGRAMLYALPNGETVRMRTCNDHVLIVVADRPSIDAKLNIEGTDWLLVVMPEVERTPGGVVVYLIPTAEAEREARRAHQAWLGGGPNTQGANRTWALWFRNEGPATSNDCSTLWADYRINQKVDTRPLLRAVPSSGGNVRTEVETARRRIAEVAGVPVDAVRITINFEG